MPSSASGAANGPTLFAAAVTTATANGNAGASHSLLAVRARLRAGKVRRLPTARVTAPCCCASGEVITLSLLLATVKRRYQGKTKAIDPIEIFNKGVRLLSR